jgi:murein DD-endopeptidase MepM/ murein hydrolase activator NlpD
MRPGPKKPGESAAEYSARVKAMEQKWMSGMGRPKTGGGPSSVKTPGPRVTDTRGSSGGDRGNKESAARDAAARAAAQNAKARAAATAAEKMKRDRDMGPGGVPKGVNPEDLKRIRTVGGSIKLPGGGTISSAGGMKKLPTPKKSAPREKVDLRDTKGQPIKDRKPVLYSGSGMKSGGMVKGKK